ncbi:MAG TPA: NUDIX domain-containing protein [Patescibacteria group bacterium]|nr:NUDIX domain-containing protein [Patescibacteria group bacterium]
MDDGIQKRPKAEITDRKRVYDGFFKVDELTIKMDTHDGGEMEVKRVIFERGHSVAILGYDPARDEVLLVNEMHPGLLSAGDDPFINALPAGMIDPGEAVLEAAVREFFEETGAQLNSARIIHEGAYVSSGGTSEKITLVIGTLDMGKVANGSLQGKTAEGEDIRVVVVKADDYIAQAESGQLRDMKCMVFALWLARNREKLKPAREETGYIRRRSLRTPVHFDAIDLLREARAGGK